MRLLDLVEESGDVSFIEVNAGDPSGLGWVASYSEFMLKNSFWDRLWGEKVRPFGLFQSHQNALRLRLGSAPVIRFLSAEKSTVDSDIRCLADSYAARGWDAELVEPRELEFRGDQVLARGVAVDALLRDTYEELYWPPYEGIGSKLERAVANQTVVVLNPLVASFWDCKNLWSLLPADSGASETLLLEDWSSDSAHKAEWVLKPSFDYGGRGVLCGFACSDQDWEDSVRRARDASVAWVMQRVAPVTQEETPYLDVAGKVQWGPSYLTWSAFVNDGRCSGFLARASQDPVVNVHNGGAIFPVLLEA